jgi:hypothetical protein
VAIWVKNFDNKSDIEIDKIDTDTINLVKFFVKSNLSLNVFQSKEFRDIVKVKLTSKHSFRNNVLPLVLKKMREIINEKLQKAISVSLISDIWSNSSMHDFIALVASISYKNNQREHIVIGMEEMDGRHTAENIQIKI